MKKIILCGHTGSNNRGCEAIVRSTAQIIKKHATTPIYFTTYDAEEDKRLLKDKNISGVIAYNNFRGISINRLLNSILVRLSKDYYKVQRIVQKNIWKTLNVNSISMNIGGDTYCYQRGSRITSYALNRFCMKKKIPNIFWGCSIEKSQIDNEMIDDLNRYTLIITRESISYHNLVQAGINAEKLRLFPDSAFTLPAENTQLPGIFNEPVVGLNLSHLIVNKGSNDTIVKRNFELLIEYVINNTNNNIALIPHVYYDYTKGKQDVEILQYFKNKYETTGRIYLFKDDLNCKQIKFIISKCRFFVGARTHATIAAYSSCIPTLVVGYSVKAVGIATDIFGNYEEYVLPVDEIKEELDLLKKFKVLESNEKSIVKHLKNSMPEYIERAWNSGKEVLDIIK